MRLVTWNLGHRRNGQRRPERLVAALASISPDIVVLVDRTPGHASEQLLDALAGAGLSHRLPTGSERPEERVLVASRVRVECGTMGADAAGGVGSDWLHAHLPAGNLDVVSVRPCGRIAGSVATEERWNALLHAAATLLQGRTVLIGDFGTCNGNHASDTNPVLRRFIADGWHHALPAEGASSAAFGGHSVCFDHAFLSPSLQQVDARYPLEAAGLRLAGSQESLSERPPLVIDLQ